MKKYKIFVACDSPNIKKVKEIIKQTKNSKITIGYKFGLEFLNSKNGRNFISKLKNETKFGDYKYSDIPNTCASAIKAVRDLKFSYLTIHINSGLNALKAAKKVSGKTKIVGVTVLTSLNNFSALLYPAGNPFLNESKSNFIFWLSLATLFKSTFTSFTFDLNFN